MVDVALKCSCGAIEGVARHVSASAGTRLVCHCGDCQAFANHLDCNSAVLDEYGGTDIYQMPISHVEITQGVEHMRCLNLKPKGLIRWYAGCCKTPIGNTVSSSMAFIGLIHSFMDDAGKREANIGTVRGYVFMKGDCPPERKKQSSVRVIVRILYKLLEWKIRGLNKPSSFFNANGEPVSAPLLVESRVNH